MNFSPNNAITVNQILSDVVLEINDEDYRLFTPGYYTSLIQQALEELSMDSFMLKLWKDFEFPAHTYSLELPKGAFNVIEVFLFNGDCNDVNSMQRVVYKRGYSTRGDGHGNISRNNTNADDYFITAYSDSEETYFCTLQNGSLVFGSACAVFEKVRVYYNGVLTNIGDVPLVPLPFRQAVKDWVVEKCYRILKGRDPRYRVLWSDIYNTLYKDFSGTWDIACKRASSLDTKVIEDYKEYFSKMNY